MSHVRLADVHGAVVKPISGTAPGRTSSRCAQDVRDVVGQLVGRRAPAGSSRRRRAATRRSAGLPEPPIQIGGRGCCTGRGRWPTSSKLQRVPVVLGPLVGPARRVIASIASSVSAPRSVNGTPSASNSPSTWPAPTPTITRPLESASSVANAFAVCERVLVRGDEHVGHQPGARRVRGEVAERRDRVEPLRRHHLGRFARDRDVMAHRDVEEPGGVARLRDARPCRRRCRARAPTASTTRTDSACTGSWIPYASTPSGTIETQDRHRISPARRRTAARCTRAGRTRRRRDRRR